MFVNYKPVLLKMIKKNRLAIIADSYMINIIGDHSKLDELKYKQIT